MDISIGEEYGRWAGNRITKKREQKPHIKVVGRICGQQWWQCRGGINYDGHGYSPEQAWKLWFADQIPF
jgi:hypothetical protein